MSDGMKAYMMEKETRQVESIDRSNHNLTNGIERKERGGAVAIGERVQSSSRKVSRQVTVQEPQI